MFENTVLLKIKRDYSKDESVNYLLGELKKVKFELGVKNSEICDLKHEVNILKNKNRILEKRVKKENKVSLECTKDEWLTEINKELDKKRRSIVKLEGDLNLWRNKYLNEVAKNEKLCK